MEQREGEGNRIVERVTDMLKRRKGEFVKERIMRYRGQDGGTKGRKREQNS